MRAATIVICTRNRANTLAGAVRGALAEACTQDADVLCVDNASTDGTPAILAGFRQSDGDRFRAVHEGVVGLSAARNRALTEIATDIVAYLDDDAVPRPGWLSVLLAAYRRPQVAGVGGPLVLRFAVPPPSWLTPAFHPAAGGFDLGGQARRVRGRRGDWFPCGANVSFRTAVARRLGGFSSLVGPRGSEHFLHDETDLCARLDGNGWEIVYAPDAVVDHWVVAEKLTASYFTERQYRSGQSAAIYALRNRGVLRSIAAGRWYLPYVLARAYVPTEPIDPTRLLAECQRREALGYFRSIARNLPRLWAIRPDARHFSPHDA